MPRRKHFSRFCWTSHASHISMPTDRRCAAGTLASFDEVKRRHDFDDEPVTALADYFSHARAGMARARRWFREGFAGFKAASLMLYDRLMHE